MKKPIIVLAVILALGSSGCYFSGPCIQGYGPVTYVVRDYQDEFTAVSNDASFDVEVSLADSFSVEVEAQENLHQFIETYVSGSTLIVKTRNGECIKPAAPVVVYVTLPYLEEIRNSGSGRLFADNAVCESFEMSNSGSGSMLIDGIDAGSISLKNTGSGELEVLESTADEASLSQSGSGAIYGGVFTDVVDLSINHTSSGAVYATVLNGYEVDAKLSGSGKIILAGDAYNAEYSLSSSGKIDALDLLLEDANIRVSGSGKVYVYATGTLDVTISSSGDVYYRGNPQNIYSKITGSGSIRRYD